MGTNTAKSQWLTYSGQATDEWSGGIATFSNGDIATAFSVSNSNGSSSVIVQRLNTSGSVVWSLDIGADYAPGAGSVLVGKDDKVYITGGTKKGASGESGLNDSDIFAASVSATGQKLWYRNYGIGIHEIGSSAVLDGNGNILLEGRVSEVNDGYSFIKDVPNFYGAEFSGGWRGFQLRINPVDGTVTKAYTTGSGNSGGGPIAIDRSRNIAFVAGYTFGAVNGVGTVGNGDPAGANTYLIARNESTGAVLWTRMENWMRSNLVVQESENAVYFVDKGNLEKVNVSTGQTIWSKALTNTNYVLSPIAGGGVLLSESESSGALTIRRFDASGTETGSQIISHTGKLYPRYFIEQGDGTIQISGTTSGAIINVPAGTLVQTGKQSGNDSFVLQINSAFSVAPKINSPVVRGNSLYTIVDGPSWSQAEANSVKLGGHLVTINNAYESDQIFRNVALDPSGKIQGWGYWTGYSDAITEGQWKWSSGENSSWTVSGWDPVLGAQQKSEPNGNSDYMIIVTRDNVGQTIEQYYASRGGYANYIQSGGPGWDDDTQANFGVAETPFIRRGDSAYVIVQGPTWEEAEANAVKLGGHLVTINDAAENDWIKNNYSANNSSVWIGFNDKAKEGSWVWTSGESNSFTAWNSGEPDGQANYKSTENAAHLVLTGGIAGKWQDIPNNSSLTGLAEIKLAPNNQPTGTPTLSGTLIAGQVITIDKTTIQDADNFTGYTPDFKYSWEVSSNGTTWTALTTTDATDNNTTYTLTTAEVGKQVRGVVSYLDGYGTQESVKTSPSTAIASTVPGVQMLQLAPPTRSALRSGVSTTSAISYNVSTGEKNLTGIESYLYFDSTQLSVATAGDPFQGGLIGQNLIADTGNADNDPKTDKILALTYADFGGNFPGTGATLPLTLATLNLVPTTTYSGTILHLKAANPATGFTATGADLTLAYNAAPVVNSTLPALTTNRGSDFSYTFRSDLFSDSDSALTFSATTATGGVLPSWLSFNPATRTLSGTPNTGGTLNLNLSASDELGTVSTPLSIKIREVQALSSATAPLRYQRNKDLTVPINYSITDGASSTGLSFKVHYNSSLLSFDPTSGVTNKAAADLFQIGAVENDTNDGDNDLTTDRFVSINIASFSGQFPGSLTPTKIADLTFRAADKGIDPITGLRDTAINFTEAEAAQGYGFAGSSAILKPLAFSLDVDGDGKVTALGDGLMVIRKLFGSAFEGDALTSKALSSTATRTTSQIHDYIQGGITSGLLDVDKDGKTTALGDGLMIVRHLFGAAFAGDALTNKALSPSSPYFGDPNASTLVAANIQSLRSVI